MELSTTKQIKRRVLEVIPNTNQELTECSITVANWLYGKSLQNLKFKISSFFINNSTMPCFIPRYISSLPSINTFRNKNLSETITLYQSVLDGDSLDYWVAISNASTNNTHVKYLKMETLIGATTINYSEYPSLKPSAHPYSASAQYKNRYYGFYNTSKFCELVNDQLSSMIATVSGVPYICEIVRNNDKYTMYVENAFFGIYDIHFSQSLIDLFQFKNIESVISTNLRTLIYNSQTSTYRSKTCASINSNYIGDQWFPYDELIFKSDIQGEPITYYDSNNYIKDSYDKIILNYRISNSQPDNVYNYFYSEINPDSSWVTLINTNGEQNVSFNILLRIKETGDLIPFTIKKNETCRFETMTIETY